MSGNSSSAHFERKRPGWFTAHVFNPFVALLTRMGISLYGSRVLEVCGRTSGQPRRTEELLGAAPKHPVFRLG